MCEAADLVRVCECFILSYLYIPLFLHRLLAKLGMFIYLHFYNSVCMNHPSGCLIVCQYFKCVSPCV